MAGLQSSALKAVMIIQLKQRRRKIMKRRKLAISVALLAGTIMSSAVPAHAVTTPVSGTKTTFDKYLVMKKNANVPNATFSYTVSIPTDDDMDDSFGERVFMNPEDTNNTNLTVKKRNRITNCVIDNICSR